MDLTKAEDIKKRWHEYTKELYKKGHHDPDNHDGAITHLRPDILEYEVKWALGSITTNKVSGGEEIPAELFLILRDDAVKVLATATARTMMPCTPKTARKNMTRYAPISKSTAPVFVSVPFLNPA